MSGDAPAKEAPTSALADTLVSVGGLFVIAAITASLYLVTVGL